MTAHVVTIRRRLHGIPQTAFKARCSRCTYRSKETGTWLVAARLVTQHQCERETA